MDEQVSNVGDLTAAIAPAPSAEPAPAPAESSPDAPVDVADSLTAPEAAAPPTLSTAPAAPPQAAPTSAPPVPEWQQQLHYVGQLEQALQMADTMEQQVLREYAATPGLSQEQVQAMLAQYQQKAAARLEATQGLQMARQHLTLQAQRAMLEAPAQRILVNELADLVLREAPGLDRQVVVSKLQRQPNGDSMMVRAQELVEDARQAALTQRAHAGTDAMSVGHPAPAPANASPEDDIAAGLRLVYGQSRR